MLQAFTPRAVSFIPPSKTTHVEQKFVALKFLHDEIVQYHNHILDGFRTHEVRFDFHISQYHLGNGEG